MDCYLSYSPIICVKHWGLRWAFESGWEGITEACLLNLCVLCYSSWEHFFKWNGPSLLWRLVDNLWESTQNIILQRMAQFIIILGHMLLFWEIAPHPNSLSQILWLSKFSILLQRMDSKFSQTLIQNRTIHNTSHRELLVSFGVTADLYLFIIYDAKIKPWKKQQHFFKSESLK